MCSLAEMVKVKKKMRKEGKILCVPSSSCPDAGLKSTFPICALLFSRVESRREGVREQDREGERVSNSGVRLSQSSKVSQAVRQAARQCICGSKQAALPLPGLITRGCAPRCSNLPGLLADPSPTGLFWERQRGLFIGFTPFIQKASVCGWLHWGRRGESRKGWGRSGTGRGGVGWRGGKGTKEMRRGELGGVSCPCSASLHSPLPPKLTFQVITLPFIPFAFQTCHKSNHHIKFNL